MFCFLYQSAFAQINFRSLKREAILCCIVSFSLLVKWVFLDVYWVVLLRFVCGAIIILPRFHFWAALQFWAVGCIFCSGYVFLKNAPRFSLPHMMHHLLITPITKTVPHDKSGLPFKRQTALA